MSSPVPHVHLLTTHRVTLPHSLYKTADTSRFVHTAVAVGTCNVSIALCKAPVSCSSVKLLQHLQHLFASQ